VEVVYHLTLVLRSFSRKAFFAKSDTTIDEGLFERLMDKDEIRGNASLTRVLELGATDFVDSVRKIYTLINDGRAFTSKLKDTRGKVLGSLSSDNLTNESGSSEANEIKFLFVESYSNLNTSFNTCDRIMIHVSLNDGFNEGRSGGRVLRRFDQATVSCNNSLEKGTHSEVVRVVPSSKYTHYTERLVANGSFSSTCSVL
jgi:hypothetical protein